MEYINGVGTLNALKMLVMSNIFRVNQPPPKNVFTSKSVTNLAANERHGDETKKEKVGSPLRSSSSFKFKNNLRLSFSNKNSNNLASDIKHANADSIVNNCDIKTDVISNTKGLLETDLDVLFGTELSRAHSNANSNNITSESKSSSDSVQTVSSECDFGAESTDSDCLDEVIRDQKGCVGARRFGYILRRVISRSGKFNIVYGSFYNNSYLH